MKLRVRFLKVIGIGILVYLLIVTLFGLLFFYFGGLTSNRYQQDVGGLFDNFYFSFATFSTIGYGDVLASSTVAKILAFCEYTLSLIYTPILGGYLFYEFFKRPNDIVFTKNILIRYDKGENMWFSLRVGNRGQKTTNNLVTVELVTIKNNVRWTITQFSTETPVLEKSWLIEIPLNDSDNIDFSNGLRFLMAKKDISFVRVSFFGHDMETTRPVHLFKDYKVGDFKYGTRYHNVYSFEGIRRTEPDWSKFNKIDPVDEKESASINKFLGIYPFRNR